MDVKVLGAQPGLVVCARNTIYATARMLRPTSRKSMIPAVRIRAANDAPPAPDRDYVLYWMIAARRPRWNFALQHAVAQAQALQRPLLIFEPLRCGYRWASDRIHAFVLEGMRSNQAAFAQAPVTYLPWLEARPGEGQGLLEALAARAALVITDDAPVFFLPRMVQAAAARLDVRVEAVDGCGLLPLAATDAEKTTAHGFRRILHRALPDHIKHMPLPDPLAGVQLPRLAALPADLLARWTLPTALDAVELARLPIDHAVPPVELLPGGWQAATARWEAFRDQRLARYGEDRNHPDQDGASGLSPWLHFGHISVHQLVHELLTREQWTAARTQPTAVGQRAGWWGLSEPTESFLDELVTWREVGHHFCHHRPDYDQYDALPDWARLTLAEHAADPRPALYSLEQLAQAQTHDPLWNAAQRQLLREGRIHNYLRMLWGKKILEWSPSPQEALERLIELNNRYALDGRDPNSYSGIFWVLGRFDRAWGPERPIYGKVRYMTSDSTQRKLTVRAYMARYGAPTRRKTT